MKKLFEASTNKEDVELREKIEKNYMILKNVVFSPKDVDPSFLQDFLIEIFQGLAYLNLNIKSKSFNFGVIKLPPKDKRKLKTLFLDLDETIIYLENVQTINLSLVNIRPFALYFLNEVSKFYEIYIFTAASKSYTKKIIDELDPENILIDGILDRSVCQKTKFGLFIKDISRIKNRELSEMVIVDNNTYTFGNSIENGIPILKYEGNKNDKQLLYLLDLLIEISTIDDVRDFLKKRYNLQNIIESNLNN